MAKTYTYSGNIYTEASAGTTTFALTSTAGNSIGYLQRSHIHVYLSDGEDQPWTEQARPSAWDFDGQGTSVILAEGLAEGQWVKLLRLTPFDNRYVDFANGSLLTADQLDLAEDYSRYCDQEIQDGVGLNNQDIDDIEAVLYWERINESLRPKTITDTVYTDGDMITKGNPGGGLNVGSKVSNTGMLEATKETGNVWQGWKKNSTFPSSSIDCEGNANFLDVDVDGNLQVDGDAQIDGVLEWDTGVVNALVVKQAVTVGEDDNTIVLDGFGGGNVYAPGNVNIGAPFDGTPTIELKKDGSITANEVKATSSKGSETLINGDGFYQKGNDGSTVNAMILADGSITAAGEIRTSNFIHAGNVDKSSTSAKGVTVSYGGTVSVQREGGNTGSVFEGWRGTTEVVRINADGSAAFKSRVDVGDIQSTTQGCEIVSNASNAYVQTRNDTGGSSNPCFAAFKGGYDSLNAVISMYYDGSINAAGGNLTIRGSDGTLKISGGSTTSDGTTLNSSGQIFLRGDSLNEAEAGLAFFRGGNSNSNIVLKATYEGSITAAGNVNVGNDGTSGTQGVILNKNGGISSYRQPNSPDPVWVSGREGPETSPTCRIFPDGSIDAKSISFPDGTTIDSGVIIGAGTLQTTTDNGNTTTNGIVVDGQIETGTSIKFADGTVQTSAATPVEGSVGNLQQVTDEGNVTTNGITANGVIFSLDSPTHGLVGANNSSTHASLQLKNQGGGPSIDCRASTANGGEPMFTVDGVGSVTAAGDVQVGAFNTATSEGVLIKASGQAVLFDQIVGTFSSTQKWSRTEPGLVAVNRTTGGEDIYRGVLNGTKTSSIDSDGNVKLGGTLPSAPKIELKASDGSAKFSHKVQVINQTGSVGWNTTAFSASFQDNTDNHGIFFVKGTGVHIGEDVDNSNPTTTQKIFLSTDGSAEFKGGITCTAATVNGGANQGVLRLKRDTPSSSKSDWTLRSSSQSLVFKEEDQGANAVTFYKDGAAEFAGSITASDLIESRNHFLVKAASDDQLCFSVKRGADKKISLLGDGSITAAEYNPTSNGVRGLNYNKFEGLIVQAPTGSDQALFTGLGGNSSDVKFQVKTDGSITAANTIAAGSKSTRLANAGWGFQAYGTKNENGYALYMDAAHDSGSGPYFLRCHVAGKDTYAVKTDGSVTTTGSINAGPAIFYNPTSITGRSVLNIRSDVGGTATNLLRIDTNGQSEFVGNVLIGGTSAAPNIELKGSDGTVTAKHFNLENLPNLKDAGE